MLDKNDYELMDYLTACMGVDMKCFAASAFVTEATTYLLQEYGEEFIETSRVLLKRNKDPHWKYADIEVDCTLLVTWGDGEVEDFSKDLPMYVVDEIDRYLDEVIDTRKELTNVN